MRIAEHLSDKTTHLCRNEIWLSAQVPWGWGCSVCVYIFMLQARLPNTEPGNTPYTLCSTNDLQPSPVPTFYLTNQPTT